MNNFLADQTLGLKKRIQDDLRRLDEIYRVGVEIEICLLDDKSLPVNASPLIKELNSRYDVDAEYGKCQLEVKTATISLGVGWTDIILVSTR